MKHLSLLLLVLVLVGGLCAQEKWSVTPYGKSCGPLLKGRITPPTPSSTTMLYLHMTKGFPSDFGFMIWGVKKTKVPVFGCLLLTDFIVGLPIRTDAGGEALFQRAWPGWAFGSFNVQFVSFNTRSASPLPVVKLTNGLVLAHTR